MTSMEKAAPPSLEVNRNEAGAAPTFLSEISLHDSCQRDVKVLCMTWNVGNADPTDAWQSIFRDVPEDVELLVIGLQESTFSIKTKTAHKDGLIASINHTKDVLLQRLPHMQLVKHCWRAQMQLYVFQAKTFSGKISHVEERIENTGFLHVFPNKGGLLVTLDVDGTKLAFISCHLSAHEGVAMCEMRNSSVAEILGGARALDPRFDVSVQAHHTFFMGDMNYRCTFSTEVPRSDTRETIAEENREAMEEKIRSIEEDEEGDEEHDEEDNNSPSGDDGALSGSVRLTKKQQKELDRSKVLALVTTESWPALLELDELNREVAACRVLSGFTPVQPSFPPTFKRRRHASIQSHGPDGKTALCATAGTRQWDLLDTDVELYRPSALDPPADEADKSGNAFNIFGGKGKKDDILEHLPENHVRKYYDTKRIPSFTDRILTRSLPRFTGNLVCDSFRSVEEADTSDHKPVQGLFTLVTGLGAADILVEEAVEAFVHNVPALQELGLVLEVVCFNIKCHNLAEMDDSIFGGGSDPFVLFTTDPPELLATDREIKSTTIAHNLNPDWAQEEVVIPLLTRDLDGIARHAHLLISVWDYDQTKRNDLIGVHSVAMKDVVDACSRLPGSALHVSSEPLLHNGLVMGHITCSLKIRCKGDAKGSFETNMESIRRKFEVSEHKKPLSMLKRRGINACCLLL